MENKKKFMLRRFVAFGIIFALIGSFLVLAFSDTPVTTITVATVGAGESLWDMSEDYIGSNSDPREWIFQVIELNNLNSATIFPGQTLIVPIWE